MHNIETVSKPFSRLFGNLLVYVIATFSLYVVVLWGLWHMPNSLIGMYANTDGMWAAWNLEGSLKWGVFLDPSPFNILSGMGSMFLPNLPWLNPAALSLNLPFPRDLNYAISYTIYFVELCVSNILLLRILGFSAIRSAIGAQLYAVMLFPPTAGVIGTLSWYSLAPVNAHLVATANFMLVLFLVLGQYRLWVNLVCAIGMFALTLVGFFSAPITFLTYVPTYGLAAGVLVLGQRPDRQALFWKIGTVSAIGISWWLIGIADYLAATAAMSARSANFPPAFAAGSAMLSIDYWLELWRKFNVCQLPEVLLCNQHSVFWFQVLSLLGAVIQLFKRQSALRPLAAWFLIYVAFIHFYELVASVFLFGKLHVISTRYLVWSLYTFYALFLAVFVFALLDLGQRLGRSCEFAVRGLRGFMGGHIVSVIRLFGAWGGWSKGGTAMLLLIIPAYAYYLWVVKIAPYQPPPPPNKSAIGLLGPSSIREAVVGPITKYLIRHASLTPNGLFRGYTATYFGDPAGHIRQAVGYQAKNMAAEIYVEARQYLDQHYGNRFQEIDLWGFDVPTLEEYGQWVTKQVYAFTTEMFASPGDQPNSAFLRIYKLDIDILRTLGVRFLITDTLLEDARLTLRSTEKSPSAGPIYLYEIDNPNLGTYSPTRPIKANGFPDAFTAFKQHKETTNSEVIVFDDLVGPFLPARKVAMRAQRDGFRITAESDGRSMLLLPIQFSRCFSMKPAESDIDLSSVHLRRGNGVQTLIEFQGRVDVLVRFDFGLLGKGRCRIQDGLDMDNLGLAKLQMWRWPPPLNSCQQLQSLQKVERKHTDPNPAFSFSVGAPVLRQKGKTVLQSESGKAIPVTDGLAGYVEGVFLGAGGMANITGWAIDETITGVPETVVLTVHDRVWVIGTPGIERSDIAKFNPAYLKSGFKISGCDINDAELSNLRVYAVLANGTARELRYSQGVRHGGKRE